MIKAPSVLNEYTLICSGDPALKLPEDEAERDRALERARDTGDWSVLIGDEPATEFRVRPLSPDDLAWWEGESAFSPTHQRPLGNVERHQLLLRLALRGVDNLPKFTAIRHAGAKGRPMLVSDESWKEFQAALGPHAVLIINDLAGQIWARAAAALNPKS